MTGERYESNEGFGRGDGVRTPGAGGAGGPRMSFGCGGMTMGDATAHGPCGLFIRRHPVVVSTIAALVGLTCIAVAAGVVLAILGCLGTW